MKTLKCEELEVGMRVFLTKPDKTYTIGKSNPLFGSRWECLGTVRDRMDGAAHVTWDNGHTNGYKDWELSSECGGRCKSIWE